jgi:ATP-dependent DNA helicase
VLDIIDYYLDSKGLNVCRIDGSVKLEDRRRQVTDIPSQYVTVLLYIISMLLFTF